MGIPGGRAGTAPANPTQSRTANHGSRPLEESGRIGVLERQCGGKNFTTEGHRVHGGSRKESGKSMFRLFLCAPLWPSVVKSRFWIGTAELRISRMARIRTEQPFLCESLWSSVVPSGFGSDSRSHAKARRREGDSRNYEMRQKRERDRFWSARSCPRSPKGTAKQPTTNQANFTNGDRERQGGFTTECTEGHGGNPGKSIVSAVSLCTSVALCGSSRTWTGLCPLPSGPRTSGPRGRRRPLNRLTGGEGGG